MRYEIITGEKEGEEVIMLRFIVINDCPTVQGFAEGIWHDVVWFDEVGMLGLSPQAKNIPGLQAKKSGEIETF